MTKKIANLKDPILKVGAKLNNFTVLEQLKKTSSYDRYTFQCNTCGKEVDSTQNQVKVKGVTCCENESDFIKKIAEMREKLEEGKIIEYTIYKSKTIKFYFEYYHKKKCRIANSGSLKIMSENQPRSKKYVNESTILIGDTIESTEKGLAIRRRGENTFNSSNLPDQLHLID